MVIMEKSSVMAQHRDIPRGAPNGWQKHAFLVQRILPWLVLLIPRCLFGHLCSSQHLDVSCLHWKHQC